MPTQSPAAGFTAPARTPVRVIGWGGELRGDDAAGLVFVRRLEAEAPPGVAVVEVPQLTPELAWDVAAADRVYFVDAVAPGAGAGAEPVFSRLEAAGAAEGVGRFNPTCVHSLRPERLLELAALLYDRRPEAWLLGLPVADFDIGFGLSPLAERGIEAALALLRARLRPQTPAPALS